jgi:hypothetical protein
MLVLVFALLSSAAFSIAFARICLQGLFLVMDNNQKR